MNKVYQRIWSKVKERWILVDEKTSHGSGPAAIVGAITLAAFLSFSGTSSALEPDTLPTTGQITSGQGSISTSGNQMTVNQYTPKMIVKWPTFNIGKNAGVTFWQPAADSVALNKIYDQNPSLILGSLSANGKIFLINPSGIVFGQGAKINVGGLVASSLDMLDSDFLAGKYTFINDGKAGSIINQGDISVMPGGIVALIGPTVTNNEGTITATSGDVLMAAGNQVSLDFNGDGLISYTVDKGAVDALAENKGLIKADGGLVVMTAKAADTLTGAVVNQSGVIQAQTLENKSGRILLSSDMDNGTIYLGGKLDASAPNGGDIGFVEISAKNVIADGVEINASSPQGVINQSQNIEGNIVGYVYYDLGTDINALTTSTWNGGDGYGYGYGSGGNVYVGGLVGQTGAGLTINTSTGSGSVSPDTGGLVGTPGIVTNSYATGSVTSASVGITSVVGRVASGPITSSTLPTGGKIVSGSGSISTAGRQMTVNQDTQKMIANWDTFNIGKRAGVTFRQPDSDAVALNRIYDQNPSQIMGSLSANGNIFLINPSGIVFGKSAQINVGGLVASSLDMLDSDFLAGKYTFTRDGNAGSIINQGDISVIPGGIVALIAPQVTNEGTITATSGNVLMAAGDKVSLDFNGDDLISYTVDQGAVDALAENNGLIKADGGVVVMTAEAADALTSAVVNNTGVIRARTRENKGGRIMLLSDMESGTTIVDGKLDASAPKGGDGGFIETSAKNVTVKKGADVTTKARRGESGTWLIDPTDYIIGTDITGATLSSNLNNGNILIQTAAAGAGNGDIFVNEDVSWSANNTLTLEAYRNINFNADITAKGSTAGLVITPDTGGEGGSYYFNNGAVVTLSGLTPSLTIAGNAYTVINEANGGINALQNMNLDLDGYYALGTNINATPTKNWNEGLGFDPVGDSGVPFTGTFEGLGNTIGNIVINRPMENDIGLFGYTSGSTISNVRLSGGSVIGEDNVGGLVGSSKYSAITNVFSSIKVSGDDDVGGLVGDSYGGSIFNSRTSGLVQGDSSVGGLIGENDNGIIDNSSAIGAVKGKYGVGGLIGSGYGMTVTNSYATGVVSGEDSVGGLIGRSSNSNISSSHATGAVVGRITNSLHYGYGYGYGYNSHNVGGLVGSNYGGSITDSYATGDVQGDYRVGGLVGQNRGGEDGSGSITDSYATGAVSGYRYVGGLVGSNDGGNIYGSHASGAVVGKISSGYGYGNGEDIGGLVGRNSTDWYGNGGAIDNSYATGIVSGEDFVGGLVGTNGEDSSITDSYATGMVSGDVNVGGLAGYNRGSIDVSHATGAVIGEDNVGGLAGYNRGSIDGSYATGSVTGSGDSIGGLVGSNGEDGSINNAYATGDVQGDYNVGGLVGFNYGGTITNAFAGGAVRGDSRVGGLVGNNYGSISSSHAVGAVYGDNNVGGFVGYNYNGNIANAASSGTVFGYGNVGGFIGYNNYGSTITNGFWDTDTSGVGTGIGGGFNDPGVIGKTTNELMQQASYSGWNVDDIWWMAEGYTRPFLRLERSTNATEEGVIIISNAHQLQLMALDPAADYTLAADLDLTDALSNPSDMWGVTGFNPVGDSTTPFTGTFDGQNHIITNLFIDHPDQDDVGMIGYMGEGSSVRNVGLSGGKYGYGSVTGRDHVGALVGFNNGGSIDNTYAGVFVSGDDGVGGLVGVNAGSITNSYTTMGINIGPHKGSDVSGSSYVGGLVGINYGGSINTSYSTFSVSGDKYGVGGLVGANYGGSIENAYATGDVSGVSNAGGLVGFNEGSINNAFATGLVDGHYEVGGLVGFNEGSINNSYATGLAYGIYGVGGLVGINFGSINNSYATGLAYGNDTTGGLVGANRNSGSITNAYATGAVSGSLFTGGLVGFNESSITNAYATGKVIGDNQTGGLVGSNYGIITNTFSTGDVTGNYRTGGLVGYNNGGSLENSYATGLVNNGVASGDCGGLVGDNSGGSAINSFWDVGTTGQAASALGTASDTTNMRTNALTNGLYLSWDTGIWNIADGSYPTLQVFTPAVNVWEGDVDSLWTTAGNWSLGYVPTIFQTAQLDGSAIDIPSIVMVKNVTETDGATLNFTGATVSSLAIGQNNTVTLGSLADPITIEYGDSGKINLTGSGAPLMLSLNGTDYVVIQRLGAEGSVTGTDLQGINGGLGGNYVLGLDIDASSAAPWNGSTGFMPIGPFTGVMDGLGHSVNNLPINRDADNQGLFGSVNGAAISNIGVLNANITGDGNVGGLVGYNYGGSFDNTWSTGVVSGKYGVGGLVGYNYGGSISNSRANASTFGIVGAGGLVGINKYGSIENSHATGTTFGMIGIGGLVGLNKYGSSITGSWASGNVTGMGYGGDVVAGGLVGYNDGSITNSWASGNVTGMGGDGYGYGYGSGGNVYVGGLVGQNNYGSITGSWASGNVTGTGGHGYGYGWYGGYGRGGNVYAGGLIGEDSGGSITNSHATGNVTATGGNGDGNSYGYGYGNGYGRGGNVYAGGLIGRDYYGSISDNSYATGSVTGIGGMGVGYGYGYGSDVNGRGGSVYVGGLIGRASESSVADSYATGSVTGIGGMGHGYGYKYGHGNGGNAYVGGLIGRASESSVADSYATGTVTGIGGMGVGYGYGYGSDINGTGGSVYAGGLIGRVSYGTITESEAHGSVTGIGGSASGDNSWWSSGAYGTGGSVYAGGLVGEDSAGNITNSDATGAVTAIGGRVYSSGYGDSGAGGSVYAGGLVGYNYGGDINTSSAVGQVAGIAGQGMGYGSGGDAYVGGLIGVNRISSYGSGGNIYGSSADGDVLGIAGSSGYGYGGNAYVGGLVGFNDIGQYGTGGNITDSSSTSSAFGLAGDTHSYGGYGGNAAVGGLVGFNNIGERGTGGNIYGSSATGMIVGSGGWGYGYGGDAYVGGLVGRNFLGKYGTGANIDQSYASGAVTGVAGQGYDWWWGGAGGDVYAGGLVGSNSVGAYGTGANIHQSYATGIVTGTAGWGTGYGYYDNIYGGHAYVGGLVGYNRVYPYGAGANITESFATGDVYGEGGDGRAWGYGNNAYAGNAYVGGLVGLNDQGGIADAYATGDVTGMGGYARNRGDAYGGDVFAGGLVGLNRGNVERTYATGAVSGYGGNAWSYGYGYVSDMGDAYAGGLVGHNDGTVLNSFWDTETSGTFVGIGGGTDSGATGLTTAEMMTLSTFTNAGWSIDDAGGTGLTWRIYDGRTYPLLRHFLTPLSVSTVDGGSDTKTYDGTPYYLIDAVYDPADAETSPNLFCVLTYGGSDGAVHAGTYDLALGGLFSNQMGYDIDFGSGTLTIDPAPISFTGERVYDGTTVFDAALFGDAGTILTGIGTETIVLTGAGSVPSKNVADGLQIVTPGALTINDGTGLASDYTFVGGVQTGMITPLALTGSISTGTSVYGSVLVPGTAVFDNAVAGDDLVGTVEVDATGLPMSSSGNPIVGTYINIESVSALTGADAGNYTFGSVVGDYTVTPLAITGNITAADRNWFFGSTSATITSRTLAGAIAGDVVNYTGGIANFADGEVGVDKLVTGTGLYLTGADAINYTVNDTAITTADILPFDWEPYLYGAGIGIAGGVGIYYLASLLPEPVPPQIDAPQQEKMLPPSFQLASYLPPAPVVEGVSVEIVRSWQSPDNKTKGGEGLIVVGISESLAQPGSFFTFTLPESIIDQIEDYDYKVKMTLADGSPLPAWLHYDNASKTFTAVNVPEGYLPVTILLDFGGQIWKIELKQQE